jgi:hypothetical protein
MGRTCSRHGGEIRKIFLGKSEVKRTIGISRRKYEDDIKTDLQEVR